MPRVYDEHLSFIWTIGQSICPFFFRKTVKISDSYILRRRIYQILIQIIILNRFTVKYVNVIVVKKCIWSMRNDMQIEYTMQTWPCCVTIFKRIWIGLLFFWIHFFLNWMWFKSEAIYPYNESILHFAVQRLSTSMFNNAKTLLNILVSLLLALVPL